MNIHNPLNIDDYDNDNGNDQYNIVVKDYDSHYIVMWYW